MRNLLRRLQKADRNPAANPPMIRTGPLEPDPKWKEVYLIGGGTSLAGFDFTLLKGKTIVALNDGFLKLPNAAAVISIDPRWINHRRKELALFRGEKYFILPTEYDGRSSKIAGVDAFHVSGHYLKQLTEYGLSDIADTIHVRGNTGYAAVNVAYLKGARLIYLLGYDFYDHQNHWFGNYSWKSGAQSHTYDVWASDFTTMLPQLDACEVNVVNVGERSKITAFPRISLSAFKAMMLGELTDRELSNVL